MPEKQRKATVLGGLALVAALAVGGCGSSPAAPPPPPPPTTTVPTTPPTTDPAIVEPTTATPDPPPVVTPKDGTNVKACADGSCEVAIDGPRTFRVLGFTAKATPGPGSISLDVENQDISQSSNGPVTEPGQLGGVGSGGVNVDYAFTGLDAQGRPVLTFTRG